MTDVELRGSGLAGPGPDSVCDEAEAERLETIMRAR